MREGEWSFRSGFPERPQLAVMNLKILRRPSRGEAIAGFFISISAPTRFK
jgi:hypothetical protein